MLLGKGMQEQLARVSTIAVLIFVPVAVWWYDGAVSHPEVQNARMFTLTGIGSEGRWTLEEVRGYNYWWKTFSPAAIEVKEGDLVVLRLKSADVIHTFYAPTLGIGPIQVEPGHVQEVTFRATHEGVHEYYCIAVCGECHFFMRGKIVVGDAGDAVQVAEAEALICAHDAAETPPSTPYERGKYLFVTKGCITCHGEGGRGSVSNPNYIKGTVPALNKLSRSLSLVDEAAAEELIKLIEAGHTPEEIGEMDVDIPRQRLVAAKYEIVRDVIRKGRDVARADTTSFEPPLLMPSWRANLSEKDIDALLIYLLKEQAWEDGSNEY